MKRKRKESPASATSCQLRGNVGHPFGALRSFVPLGCAEDAMYRQLREAIPALDAAVVKLVRLSGGFTVSCPSQLAQEKLENFLKTVPCGRGQMGIDSFLSGYLDNLLVYGRSIAEMVVERGRLRAVCWADVTQLQIVEGDSPLDVEIWGPNAAGRMAPLPYPHLLLFSTLNPEAAHPYGVSLFRGMPFLADILMKIYSTIGVNWERAGNVRYSIVCKDDGHTDPATLQERSRQIAQEWGKAMEDAQNGTVRDFVAVGDVQIKVIGGETPILDSEIPVRQILEQLIAKTGLPPFLLGFNWSTTERMSTQQADILTSELWALRRSIEPVVQKICKTYLALEGLDDRVHIEWTDVNLQDATEEAKAALYWAQAEKYRAQKQQGG